MSDKKSDLDAEHDSARIWYEKAGRFLKLSMEAQEQSKKFHRLGEEFGRRKKGVGRLTRAAKLYARYADRLLRQARAFVHEARRAEALGRW